MDIIVTLILGLSGSFLVVRALCIYRVELVLFKRQQQNTVDENDGVKKPSSHTPVRNIKNRMLGHVIPNQCHAIKVLYSNGSTSEYFRYSVFWDENEVVKAGVRVTRVNFGKKQMTEEKTLESFIFDEL